MTVKIGIGLFTGQLPAASERSFAQEYREMLDLVRLAETLGFDSAWVSEHHGSSDGYLPSLLTMLAAFAASTEHIELGTGVVLTPLHDPIRLAEDVAVVDQLSGGRLLLGLGLGWREEEFRMLRVPLAERLPRTVETVEIIRRAGTGHRFSFEGQVFRYDRVKVTPPVAREGGVPIFLGGYTDRSLRRAGRLADAHITDAVDAEELKSRLHIIDEGAREVGRDPLPLALLQNAFVWEDGDHWDEIRDGVLQQYGCYAGWEGGDDTPERDSLTPSATDEELRAATPCGSPEDVAHALRPLVETFADDRELHLIVRLHYPGMGFEQAARAMELFAGHVTPALRGS